MCINGIKVQHFLRPDSDNNCGFPFINFSLFLLYNWTNIIPENSFILGCNSIFVYIYYFFFFTGNILSHFLLWLPLCLLHLL